MAFCVCANNRPDIIGVGGHIIKSLYFCFGLLYGWHKNQMKCRILVLHLHHVVQIEHSKYSII